MKKRIFSVLLTIVMLIGLLPTGIIAATCSHPNMETTVVPPTCYEAGYTQYHCPDCKETFKFTGEPALNHPNMETTVVPPTCYAAGYTQHYCPDCKETFKFTGEPALNHPNMTETVVPPTCYKEGYTLYSCPDCGENFKHNVVPALNHPNMTETVVPPTCYEEGYTLYSCPDCGENFKHNIVPSINHPNMEKTVIGATCYEEGCTLYHCPDCGETFKHDVVDALNHPNMQKTVVPPTCYEEGYTLYSCPDCGENFKHEIVAPTNHPNITKTVVPATCYKEGYTLYSCPDCGENFKHEVVPALNHPNMTKTVVPPTCYKEGYTLYSCPDCGENFKHEVVPALNHPNMTKTVVPPTCYEEGYTLYSCPDCGENFKHEIVAPTNHPNMTKTVVPATCIEEGYTLHSCPDCGDSFKREIVPATGKHTYVDSICTVCGDGCKHIDDDKNEVCDKCGKDLHTHTFGSDWMNNAEKHWHICPCGEKSNEASHIAGNWIVDIDATSTKEGQRHIECTVCGYYMAVEKIPAKGLDFNYNNMFWGFTVLQNQTFNISATASEGGTITPAGVTNVKYNQSIVYTITPDEGYEIADVIIDGNSIGAVETYKFYCVIMNHTISVIFEKTEWDNPYTDVSDEEWYYEDIKFVSEKGLMNGTSSNGTKFSTNVLVNRAMLVTALWRIEGCPVIDGSVDLYDVPDNEWYTAAVNWAASKGIVNGYGDGSFGAMNELTHEQIMAILNRYAVYKKWSNNISGKAIGSYSNSDWAENNVLWADINGMFDGIGSDISDLTEGADRAELAAYLRRFCERFIAE